MTDEKDRPKKVAPPKVDVPDPKGNSSSWPLGDDEHLELFVNHDSAKHQAAIKKVQEKLDNVLVDGQFGPQTFVAVKKFQAEHPANLNTNGEVDKLVWEALGL